MAIMVLLQKTTASYFPRFNFGGPFLDEKSDFQIFNILGFLPKLIIFQKFLRVTIFKEEGCFWILALNIQEKTPVKKE